MNIINTDLSETVVELDEAKAHFIQNYTDYTAGAKTWQLEPRSAYLFSVSGIGAGNVADNITGLYLIHTGEQISSTAQVFGVYRAAAAETITVNNCVLTYPDSYQYCLFSLTKL